MPNIHHGELIGITKGIFEFVKTSIIGSKSPTTFGTRLVVLKILDHSDPTGSIVAVLCPPTDKYVIQSLLAQAMEDRQIDGYIVVAEGWTMETTSKSATDALIRKYHSLEFAPGRGEGLFIIGSTPIARIAKGFLIQRDADTVVTSLSPMDYKHIESRHFDIEWPDGYTSLDVSEMADVPLTELFRRASKIDAKTLTEIHAKPPQAWENN